MSDSYQFLDTGIDRILIPIDFSSVSLYALDFAALIAHQAESSIFLLHVVSPDLSKAEVEEIRQANEQRVDDIRTEKTNLWGIRLHQQVMAGNLQDVISNAIDREKIDLVIMGTEGGSGITNWTRYYYGSNAYRTAAHIACPVITLQEGKALDGIKTIVFPLDVSKETAQKIERAIKLAELFDATVHLITVSNFYDEFKSNVAELQLVVDELAQKMIARGIRVVTKAYRNRDIADTIMNYTDNVDADLLMIMTRQESDLNSFFLGSNAKKIISNSKVPVLSMHPDYK